MPIENRSDKLSLYDIESGLAEVLAAREEACTPEEIAATDAAIVAYCQAEVQKADSIAAYVRHCKAQHAEAKAEAERLTARAAAWDGRRKRLLDFVERVMRSMGKRLIEGKHSTLLLKGNGGKQAVIVDSSGLVPCSMLVFTGSISGRAWESLIGMAKTHDGLRHWLGRQDVIMSPSPMIAAIHEELSAGRFVPGCRLADRSEHVEVK